MTDGVELISRFLITRGVAKGKFENFREFFISSNSLSGCQISDGISNLCQSNFALLVRRRLSIRFWLGFIYGLINTHMKSFQNFTPLWAVIFLYSWFVRVVLNNMILTSSSSHYISQLGSYELIKAIEKSLIGVVGGNVKMSLLNF